MTLIGAFIGIVLSYGAVEGLNAAAGQRLALITPSLLFSVTLYAVFLGALSGFLPAREASRLQPAVVLRYE